VSASHQPTEPFTGNQKEAAMTGTNVTLMGRIVSPGDAVASDRRAVGMRWLPEDWRVLQHEHPNVMIVGPADRADAALSTVLAGMSNGVYWWTNDVPLPSGDDARTVVIRDVTALTPELQRVLLSWTDDPDRPSRQVVSTSTISLFPLVEHGRFLDGLYYRLNTVLLDLRSAD
jgi:hypothetical protein